MSEPLEECKAVE
jgi:hypothetical protein